MRSSALNYLGTGYATTDFAYLLEDKAEQVFAGSFFTVLARGLTPDQWRLYAKQFYVSCLSFDKLLKTAVENARKTGDATLIAELEENLADERGENSAEKIPHSVLRERFFQAIGLPETDMKQDREGGVPILPGTAKHTAAVNEIIESGCFYTQVGAFIAQEYMASGDGFWLLEAGVTKSFPAMADRNNEAMQYVYGHLDCDAKEHLPDLLEAIEPLMAQPDIRQKILAGAETMLDIEDDLFDSFTRDILESDPLQPLSLLYG